MGNRDNIKLYVFKDGPLPEKIILMSKSQYEQVCKLPGDDINGRLRYLLQHQERLLKDVV